MGQHPDYLYNLVFQEALQLWQQAQREGRAYGGPTPERFFIQEYAEIDWQNVRTCGSVLQSWSFQGELPPKHLSDSSSLILNQTRSGMFYIDGWISFSVDAQQEQIVWNHILGQRYGRGKIFQIVHDDSHVRLETLDKGEWVI